MVNDFGLRDYWMRPGPEPGEPRRSPSWVVIVVIFLLGFLCGVATVAADERPCVQLRVRPTVMLWNGDIDVQTRVCRQDENRTLRVSWTSADAGAGSSERSLDGAGAPILHQFWLINQRAAAYQFDAMVLDGRGRVLGRDRVFIRKPGGVEDTR
jgi:hypothetical protein